jgi:hypothetical protein
VSQGQAPDPPDALGSDAMEAALGDFHSVKYLRHNARRPEHPRQRLYNPLLLDQVPYQQIAN